MPDGRLALGTAWQPPRGFRTQEFSGWATIEAVRPVAATDLTEYLQRAGSEDERVTYLAEAPIISP